MTFPVYTDHDELSKEEFKEIKEKCFEGTREYSYSPYSKFRVGAAILADNGEYFIGANIENASYGAAICAERSAIVQANMHRNKKFKAIAISSDSKEPISPCGICRQVIREFGPKLPVFMFASDGSFKKMYLNDLLPFSFGPENLGINP
ncbi:cytidine deaminase [[Candida] railenensis]|uniref:Cytidine deaminase n=1 Tax=[Candida] railenensis TaxID=45579 RepID=A0A9P0QN26_9ASCO|nr:cytidine deaminase [[Candida] railenensis]